MNTLSMTLHKIEVAEIWTKSVEYTEEYKGKTFTFRAVKPRELSADVIGLGIEVSEGDGSVRTIISKSELINDTEDTKIKVLDLLLTVLEKELESANGEFFEKYINIELVKVHKNEEGVKASASMEFSNYVKKDSLFPEFSERFLAVDICCKASTEEEATKGFELLIEALQFESGEEFEVLGCPVIDYINGAWHYQDGFLLPYEHGCMGGIKKDLRRYFKNSKKGLGFK